MIQQLHLDEFLLKLKVINESKRSLFQDVLDYGQDFKLAQSHGKEFGETIVQILRPYCEQLELKRTNERLDTLEGFLKYQHHFAKVTELVREIEEVMSACNKDLSDKIFLYLPINNGLYFLLR